MRARKATGGFFPPFDRLASELWASIWPTAARGASALCSEVIVGLHRRAVSCGLGPEYGTEGDAVYCVASWHVARQTEDFAPAQVVRSAGRGWGLGPVGNLSLPPREYGRSLCGLDDGGRLRCVGSSGLSLPARWCLGRPQPAR